MSDDRFELVISPTARRQLTDRLPESVAFAAYEFIIGPPVENPHRVGKRPRPPLDDRHSAHRGTYRVIYPIDIERHLVTVVAVVHRDVHQMRARGEHLQPQPLGQHLELAVDRLELDDQLDGELAAGASGQVTRPHPREAIHEHLALMVLACR